MTTVLVLGVRGMLGSAVFKELSKEFTVYGTSRVQAEKLFLFDATQDVAAQLEKIPACDYIINCIGIIKPYCKDDDPVGVVNAIKVNALFPHLLAKTNAKVIQIATDCVYSGKEGQYKEDALHDPLDVYGKTKSLGEPENVLNIRCSIIGPEQKGKLSLLEWFLGQQDGAELKGFTHHTWNGITTRRFAALCAAIIKQNAFATLLQESHVHHYVPKNVLNKYELLTLFKEVFGKNVSITPTDALGTPVDRTLATSFTSLAALLPPITIEDDVQALVEKQQESL